MHNLNFNARHVIIPGLVFTLGFYLKSSILLARDAQAVRREVFCE